MSKNTKRKLDHFDPNKSDSDDGDYDNSAPAATRTKHRVKGRGPRPLGRKPPKRKRERYGDSDDDIEDDDDDISEDEISYSESEDEEAPINPATGRRQRTTAQKQVKYEESSEDEVLATSDDEDTSPPPRRGKGVPRPSRLVILRISPERMRRATTTRSGRVSGKREPTPDLSDFGTRRSSRISRASEEPLVQLSTSGKHAVVTRRGSGALSADESDTHPHMGGKSLKNFPSAIFEASHEDSPAQEDDDEPNFAPDVDMEDEPDVADEGDDARHSVVDEAKTADAEAEDDDDDDDEGPINRRTSRSLRKREEQESPPPERRSLRTRSKPIDQSSDFEPDGDEGDAEEENVSSDDELGHRRNRNKSGDESSVVTGRRSGRLTKRGRGSKRPSASVSGGSELDLDEIADEAADLAEDRLRNKRPRRGRRAEQISFEPNLRNRSFRPDYRVWKPELQAQLDDEENAAPPPASQGRSRGKAAGPWRTLFSTLGAFGGAAPTVPGGLHGAAAGGADSDSSDDDTMRRPSHAMGAGGVNMTPTQGQAPFGLVPQPHNSDATQAGSGAPANFGKVKDRKALADADPLGVDPNVSFDGVGGLGDHIDRLKEMVALPLLYPEIFMRMHVTPPRGVLFHGPPGTGKTLLARALASSVSSHGKKVTFYMRKGADALSKWVGEAERQLRLLFEEARKNQPSIIFFDEIDGLAPVRSSKQEQIHASIVATLLALMDGMDGRGQVIVIGATNRPDSVDPALRRPGRFDREFYFPLPNKDARRSIIDIHTKGWEPALQTPFKDQLAELTKGYGGADLRALCTEAALNAVQGTYPQIYSSNKKLLIDPTKIKVLAKDFMISVNKIVPSSERSATSGSAPLKKSIEPLLRNSLAEIENLLKEIVPRNKKRTALEEAQYDDRDDELGFEKENMQRDFEGARIFRPRLLISGLQGMGQQYLGAALLNKFEGMYVANFDLPNIYKDSTRSPEAAIVQMFEEVKRHKPSVVYIPNVDIWYRSLQDSVIRTFTGLLRSLPPTDPVLLLGIMELSSSNEKPDMNMIRDLFSYSTKNLYQLERPDQAARQEYFSVLVDYVRRSPAEFPDPENRKKREIPVLPEAPSAVTTNKEPTKDDIKKQKKNDRYTLFTLKLHIQPVMDQIKLKYRKFRMPPIDERTIEYLFNEQDPEMLTTDLAEEQAQELMYRPYKIDTDGKGVTGLREIATGRFYYNLDIAMIEDRLSNGYYKRPTDFRADIKRLAKDAKTMGDHERILKANEMYANVEVDMTHIETAHPALVAECEAVYQRELAREAEMRKKGKQAIDPPMHSDVANTSNDLAESSSTSNHLGIQNNNQAVSTPSKSDLSNGVAHRDQEDIEMGNTASSNSNEVGSGPQQQYTTPVQGTQTKSQHSSIMQMAPGSQPKDYVNSASTTTSGQKTTDRSNRDSGHTGNTQMSNGTGHGNGGIDFSLIEPLSASQLPDTQEQPNASQITPLSSPTQNHPQPMGPPVARAGQTAVGPGQSPPDQAGPQHARQSSDIDSLLNHPSGSQSQQVPLTTASSNGQTSMRAPILVPADNNVLAEMSRQLVHRSSGLSVEQLEQVMASLMRAIWNSKTEWNRNVAVKAVEAAFNETVRDLESVQEILRPSQDDEEYADVGRGRGSGGSSVGQVGGDAWWGAQSAP